MTVSVGGSMQGTNIPIDGLNNKTFGSLEQVFSSNPLSEQILKQGVMGNMPLKSVLEANPDIAGSIAATVDRFCKQGNDKTSVFTNQGSLQDAFKNALSQEHDKITHKEFGGQIASKGPTGSVVGG